MWLMWQHTDGEGEKRQRPEVEAQATSQTLQELVAYVKYLDPNLKNNLEATEEY